MPAPDKFLFYHVIQCDKNETIGECLSKNFKNELQSDEVLT